jgi:tRNA 2-thiouridine synthesizing protein A
MSTRWNDLISNSGLRNEETIEKATIRNLTATRNGFIMDIKNMKADEILDCVGLACPMPIFKTSTKIKELAPGQVLEVQSDDDGIEQDMPAWCRRTGHEYLGQVKENDEYRVFVKKR